MMVHIGRYQPTHPFTHTYYTHIRHTHTAEHTQYNAVSMCGVHRYQYFILPYRISIMESVIQNIYTHVLIPTSCPQCPLHIQHVFLVSNVAVHTSITLHNTRTHNTRTEHVYATYHWCQHPL